MQSTFSSRDFNQDISKAKRAADEGPVLVTDRGKPAYVLMRYEHYKKISESRQTLFDIFADPRPEADFDFELKRFDVTPRPVDLS